MGDSKFLSSRRKRLRYFIRHTIPGGWCGLSVAIFLVALFILFLSTTDIPICAGLPPLCWVGIFPGLVLAILFWLGLLGGFPTEFISEDDEETAPLSNTPEMDKIYDPGKKFKQE